MSILRYRGTHIDIEIHPAKIAREFSHLEGARKVVARAARGDQALADRAMARWIMNAVENMGGKWSVKASAALENIHGARENLISVFEGVLRGEFPDVGKVHQELARLEKSFEIMDSPETAIAHAKTIEPPPTRSPLVDQFGRFTYTIKSALGDQDAAFNNLSELQRGLLRDLAEAEPHTTRKAVVAETKEGFDQSTEVIKNVLEKQGKKTEEVQAAVEAMKKLNESWRQQTAKSLPMDHILRLVSQLGELPPQRLRNALLRSRLLQELAMSNPEALKAMWKAYEAKGKAYPFENYVGFIQRHVRGLVGEYQLAFHLGDGLILLKGPDAHVTLAGTDAVALNLKTGEVVLLDNKALKSADPLGKVDALTRNLPQNIAKDAAEFQATIGVGPDVSIQVSAAIKRIQEAAAEIQLEVTKSGLSKDAAAKDPAMQAKIQDILKKKQILRQVGNAGGNTRTLTDRLNKLDFTVHDVYEPRPLIVSP